MMSLLIGQMHSGSIISQRLTPSRILRSGFVDGGAGYILAFVADYAFNLTPHFQLQLLCFYMRAT